MKISRYLALAGLILAGAPLATGAPASYTIDTSSSYLQLAVAVLQDPDPPLIITTAQSPGSDLTSLFGSIDADLTGGTIQFTGASIGLNLQPVDQAPGPFGDPGTAPAQIGLFVDVGGLVTGPAAVRDTVVGATSAPLALGGGVFDATGVDLELTAGVVDLNLAGFLALADRLDIAGYGAFNESAGGTLTTAGLVETLTIPVTVTVPIESEDIPLPLAAMFVGEIVATRAVPEPSSLALAVCGLAISAVAVWRRRG